MGGEGDWERPRGRNEHFTEEEKAFIRNQFRAGAGATAVARALKAARRTITEHYARLRSEIAPPTLSRADYTARLYKPDFEL